MLAIEPLYPLGEQVDDSLAQDSAMHKEGFAPGHHPLDWSLPSIAPAQCYLKVTELALL